VTGIQIFKDSPFVKPEQGLCPVTDAARMIGAGRVLLLAGTEEDLANLPQGRWIGGTAGHFLTPQGCVPAGGVVFYIDFTALAAAASWRSFGAEDVHQLAGHYPENGFAILILPGFSQLLGQVAGSIMEFDGLYNLPLMGWVSSVPLGSLPAAAPQARPKIFAGGPVAQAERAAVLYVTLAPQYFAQLQIANLFAPGDGPEIRFPQPGQIIDGDCLIGGVRRNLARYMAEAEIDQRLPLVADHEGALLNVAILQSEPQSGRVTLLGPVSPALTYRFAAEVPEYEAAFSHAAAEIVLEQAAHACICVLHYHYAGLTQPDGGAGPALGITAPVTFGQIAYTVLNQTLSCLTISQVEDGMEEMRP
jgi:hypothetical protein